MLETLREKFADIAKDHGLESEKVQVFARPLTPEEAIGRPEKLDYPLVKGKERLIQANLKGAYGQAFTDMFGEYEGTISDILLSELRTNFHRAVFISTFNAVMNHYIREKFGHPKITMVGLQPRMAETLSTAFPLKAMDLDPDNIGKEKFGIPIEGPERTRDSLLWCDVVLITGTTIVNGTIGEFLIEKPKIFYGVTISGAAKILGLNHFCPYGKPR
jgi:hypothetical protein